MVYLAYEIAEYTGTFMNWLGFLNVRGYLGERIKNFDGEE